jgi:hypothetical protein
MKESKEKYFQMFENFKINLLKRTSEITHYKNWSNEFAREEISDAYLALYKAFDDIDYTQFTSDELSNHFGFSKWNDNLILIPLWLLKTIKNGTTVHSISGSKLIVGEDTLDSDNRYGMTAYGFTKSQLRDERIEEVLNDTK